MSIDSNQIIRNFDRAAEGYDEAAFLPREVADRLFSRLDYIKIQPKRILTLGCGTGYELELLKERYPKAELYPMDIATAMLHKARRRAETQCINGDMCQLPLAKNSVDMIISNMSIHWCKDFNLLFREVSRILQVEGLFMFTCAGPDTLQELKQAWKTVDDYDHVHHFSDMHDIGDMLIAAGFDDPVMDMEHILVKYPTVRALMKELRGLGSHNFSQKRNHGFTAKSTLEKMQQAYATRAIENKIPATYEIIYGHAWAVEPAVTLNDEGVAFFPVDSLLKGRGR